jgi:glutaredoxin
MTSYLMFSKEEGPCPYCEKSIQLMTAKSVDFTVIYLNNEQRQRLYDSLKLVGDDRRIPQNFEVNNSVLRRIGGFVALNAELGAKT